jgi:hypothetical protein
MYVMEPHLDRRCYKPIFRSLLCCIESAALYEGRRRDRNNGSNVINLSRCFNMFCFNMFNVPSNVAAFFEEAFHSL